MTGTIAVAILLQQLMLAATYSRGGYVAFAAGILLLWYLVRRRPVWIYGLTGLVAILLTTNGTERVKSIAGVAADASIGNRLLVWRGAAGIIHANWFSGIEIPGQVYRNWYQPLWLNEHYRTMINDALTLGANYGVGAFLLYLLIFFLPIWIAIRLCRAGFRPPWFAVLPAAIAGYFVAAFFSTMYEHDELFYFVVSLLGLTGLIEWVVLLRHREFRGWSLLTVPSGLAAGCGIALLLFGGWVNRTLPYTTQSRQSQTIDSEEYHTLTAHPQGKSRGTIICLYSSDNMEIIRSTVRPMLMQGYAVTVIEVDSGLNGVEHGRRVLAQLEFSSPGWLIGEGDGGKAALLLAAEMPEDKIAGVAVCNAPGNWPFKELAPLAVIDRYPGPILLAVSDDFSGELLDEATQMAEIRRRHQLPVQLLSLPLSSEGTSADHDFLAAFEQWQQAVGKH